MITEDGMRGLYRRTFGGDAREVAVYKAPGRVNLIGEHTDYNEGFVLPVPLGRHVWIAAERTDTDAVNLYAADYGEEASFNLDHIEYDREHLWANYPMGVANALMERGYTIGGANMAISGDVPIGAGLSSSAAIEIAAIRAFVGLYSLEIDPVEMAYVGKSAENDFVGVQSGIMDQFVGALGCMGHALFIDCRTNEYEHIPLDPDFTVVTVNTMVKRELTSSAYNERRWQCEEGVSTLRESLPHIKALRDVSPQEFERHQSSLSNVVRKRCRHVVAENERVLEAVEALKEGEMTSFGGLMYESHASLRDDYEVSCAELDALVEAAQGIRGTIGARMTGAGFGGCTVNMVERDRIHSFTNEIREKYRAATGIQAEVYSS